MTIREEETTRLEAEIDIYREDIDRMLATFRRREEELIDELESVQQKNTVLSNLLDLVSDRAETAQRELDRLTSSLTSQQGALSDASVISCVSDVSVGSDDVFAERLAELTGKKVVTQDWEVRDDVTEAVVRGAAAVVVVAVVYNITGSRFLVVDNRLCTVDASHHKKK